MSTRTKFYSITFLIVITVALMVILAALPSDFNRTFIAGFAFGMLVSFGMARLNQMEQRDRKSKP
jgi:hypothetical protein